MKRLLLLLALLTACSTTETPTPPTPSVPTTPVEMGEFKPSTALNAPWKDENTQIIIDAYYLNGIDWNEMASDKRVKAVIHRSSIGLKKDTKYSERRAIAKGRGYLWGAYHFGKSGNVEKQADLLIELAGDDLMVLDLEDFGNSSYMDAKESIEFLEYVYKKTGRLPIIYANHSTVRALNAKYGSHELLNKTKLWYARFKSKVTDFPYGIWGGYFMWQFSSEINCNRTGSCLYNVAGTRYDMDVNVFDGTFEELKKYWK